MGTQGLVEEGYHHFITLVHPSSTKICSTQPIPHNSMAYRAFSTVKGNLLVVRMFHTDRESEYDNALIAGLLERLRFSRPLKMKGCLFDNAVAESTFKSTKTEFVSCRRFDMSEQLQLEPKVYVHCVNTIRLHGTLGYPTPAEFKKSCTL